MSNILLSAASTAKLVPDTVFSIIMVVLTVAVLATAIWLIARFIGAQKGKNVTAIVVITIVSGVVLRVLISLFIGGHRFEFSDYNSMIDYFVSSGVSGYYLRTGVEIYPLTYYIFGLFGGLGRVFGIASGSAYLSVMIKLPFFIADAVTSILLYRIARRYLNSEIGAVLAGLYSLCPVFMMASAAWGSVLMLLVPLLVGSFWCIVEKKHLLAILLYALSMLVVKEATYLYPLYLIYYGYLFVRSIVKNIKQKVAFSDALRDSDLSLAYKLPVFFICSFLLKYLLSLPLIISDYGANPFTFIYNFFLLPLTNIDYFGYNALNVYNIFGKNAESIAVTFPSVVFVICFAVLTSAIVAIVYFSKKNRAVLPLLAAYILYTLATYFLDATAVTLIPVLALLIVAFVLIKDRRILQVFSLAAISSIIVSMATLTQGGFMNMLDATAFTVPSYSGSPALTEGFGLVMLIISSVISVAAHLYLTLVTFDVTMSSNRKLMSGGDKIGYFAGIKCLFK